MSNKTTTVFLGFIVAILVSFLWGAGCVAKNPELVRVDKESKAVIYHGKIYKLVEVSK